MATNICICGFGKMGREVMAAAAADPSVEVVSILEGKEGGAEGIAFDTSPETALRDADVAIDFSAKEATPGNAATAARLGKNVVIGTTGLGEEEKKIRTAIETAKTSGVISANFSVGVNVFIEAAQLLRERLGNYDVEMTETHHKAKKDAPSGTALRTLKAIGMEGAPVHSLRVGDVIGDHTLVFAGNSERIELTHRATSRKCFAQGAVLAAKWVAGRRDGVLHDFGDVIKRRL